MDKESEREIERRIADKLREAEIPGCEVEFDPIWRTSHVPKMRR